MNGPWMTIRFKSAVLYTLQVMNMSDSKYKTADYNQNAWMSDSLTFHGWWQCGDSKVWPLEGS